MTINIQELLDKGYKEFRPTRFDTADRRFQKRFRAENGDTLYFINVDMYYSWGIIPENFEVEVQLYQKGTHEPVNLKFFCGWTLADVEEYIQRIYEVGFEPYDES